MTHLDTNFLIGLAAGEEAVGFTMRKLALRKEIFACSAIAWSEFLAGPLTDEQISKVLLFIETRIHPFDFKQGELTAQLFNSGGRRRGSMPDCMIAAAAITQKASLASYNHKDFEKFVPLGLSLADISIHSS